MVAVSKLSDGGQRRIVLDEGVEDK